MDFIVKKNVQSIHWFVSYSFVKSSYELWQLPSWFVWSDSVWVRRWRWGGLCIVTPLVSLDLPENQRTHHYVNTTSLIYKISILLYCCTSQIHKSCCCLDCHNNTGHMLSTVCVFCRVRYSLFSGLKKALHASRKAFSCFGRHRWP